MSNEFSHAKEVLDAIMARVPTLTSDQLQVLHLISTGYSDKKIASLRHTGVRTVEHHVSNIFKHFDLDQGEGIYNRRMVISQIYQMWSKGAEFHGKK